jgi:hypothetical protein
MCSKVWVGKYLHNVFPIQNSLKQQDVLLCLVLSFAVQYDRSKMAKTN